MERRVFWTVFFYLWGDFGLGGGLGKGPFITSFRLIIYVVYYFGAMTKTIRKFG